MTTTAGPRTVDQFIDDPRSHKLAAWVLLHFRLPAHLRAKFSDFTGPWRLFCTWQGKRYRCIGASRMGDVWLAADHSSDQGYDERVEVDECSDWGATP